MHGIHALQKKSILFLVHARIRTHHERNDPLQVKDEEVARGRMGRYRPVIRLLPFEIFKIFAVSHQYPRLASEKKLELLRKGLVFVRMDDDIRPRTESVPQTGNKKIFNELLAFSYVIPAVGAVHRKIKKGKDVYFVFHGASALKFLKKMFLEKFNPR
jgi:hypothetical protein